MFISLYLPFCLVLIVIGKADREQGNNTQQTSLAEVGSVRPHMPSETFNCYFRNQAMLTFDLAVLGTWHQCVPVLVQTGDGGRVTWQQHHTLLGPQVPAPAGSKEFITTLSGVSSAVGCGSAIKVTIVNASRTTLQAILAHFWLALPTPHTFAYVSHSKLARCISCSPSLERSWINDNDMKHITDWYY